MEKNQILGLAIFIEYILAILFNAWLFPAGLCWWFPMVSMLSAIVEFLDILAFRLGYGWNISFHGMEREHIE
ncbi:hypothetical protein KEJ19_07035 [Candidatus Bathyarchaeota archaeon]|nr:hypothetical protein [Candidatus Bathyarchaeota archaeon]